MNIHQILALEKEIQQTNKRLDKLEESLCTAFRFIELAVRLDRREKEVPLDKPTNPMSTGREDKR